MRIRQLIQTLAAAATLLLAHPLQAETYYFHNDHLGTPQALTDSDGTVVWQGRYKPFGEVTETVDTVQQNIRFPGQYFEEETGLHYNYFRDYDPSIGRYIESDPIGLRGGVNTFGYVRGNPIVKNDPLGLYECGCRVESGSAGGTAPNSVRPDGTTMKRFWYRCSCKCPDGTVKRIRVIGGSFQIDTSSFPHGASLTTAVSPSTYQTFPNWDGKTSDGFDVDTEEWFFPDSDYDEIKDGIVKEINMKCEECEN